MTPLLFALALLQTAPAPAPPPTPPPAPEPAPSSPADTLAGLEQVYSTSCGQAGILYHAYDDLCDGVRKQIRSYRDKVDREQAHPTPPVRPPPKPQP